MPVINTNTSAQFAQDALKANAKVQTTAMQQLATGNRINAAKDDAAGLSIGQNMTSQIRGLNQAVRNVNDGINLLQTADGALVETSNMLQRMRELAVQSSNATNSVSQRAYLNNEFTSLKNEITRISDDTTWNNARLFGSRGNFVGPEITNDPTKLAAVVTAKAAWESTFATETTGLATALGGAPQDVTDAQNDVTTARDAMKVTLAKATGPAVVGTTVTTAVLKQAAVAEYQAKLDALATANAALEGVKNTAPAIAAQAALDAAKNKPAALLMKSQYDAAAKVSFDAGNRFDDGIAPVPTDFVFQAGIKEGQTIKISLDVMDAKGLGVDDKFIDTFENAQAAIKQMDTAIETVNNARSGMGATMNQLSYSADNMINISTNIAASRSSIMDTDYATASAQLAKTQIISQAATAMLTQANQQPQSVLALLKG